LVSTCVPATFHNLSLFGAEIVSLSATLVTNYSASVPATDRFTQPPVEVQNATFCNVTVSYTHPGQNDALVVEAWLPTAGWNGRLQAVGGGGFVAGRSVPAHSAMAGAIADGYATATTDAGLGAAPDPTTWALLSPGNVNLYALQNLASVSLEDEVSGQVLPFGVSADVANGVLTTKLGNHSKVPHRIVLWPASRLLLLEWLLTRRSPRPHAGSAVPHCLRWHRSWSSGAALERSVP
jgi:hypothetical protein